MILSAWLIAASIMTSITNGCPMFLLRAYCGRDYCGMGAAESAHATRRSYRRTVGFITFYSLRWIAGIVLRKEH